MREMKDSGIEWIGECASNCIFVPLKYFLEDNEAIKVGPFGSQLSGNDFVDEATDYWVYNQRTVLDNNYETGNAYISQEKYRSMLSFHVHSEDILITTRGTIGKISKVPQKHKDGVLHPCIIRFRIDNKKYSYKLLELIFNYSDIITRQINYKSNATTIEVIYSETLKNVILPYYDIETQIQIANYLDKKCTEIDSLILDIQKQIETLEQYKRSVITEAVTKGLYPNTKMKDSGVQWIGEIPEHWEILKIKYVIDEISDIDHYMPDSVDEGIPYIMIGNLSDRISKINFNECKHVSNADFEILSKKSKTERDDVIFARYATIGTVCYVDIDLDFLVSYACVTIHPNSEVLSGLFFYYYLKSVVFIEDVKQYINSNTQGNVGIDSLYKVRLTFPPLKEQQQIADYLDEKCAEIDSIIAEKKKQIETIEEYKKSLIFEYVTGKKEVNANEE